MSSLPFGVYAAACYERRLANHKYFAYMFQGRCHAPHCLNDTAPWSLRGFAPAAVEASLKQPQFSAAAAFVAAQQPAAAGGGRSGDRKLGAADRAERQTPVTAPRRS